MQDLGRILIDINEKGGGGAEGISGLASGAGAAEDAVAAEEAAAESAAGLAASLAAVGAAMAVAFNAIVAGAKMVYAGLSKMHELMMSVASDLRQYSPGIQLADMQNQLKMFGVKMRAGMAYGGFIGGAMLEGGRIERTLMELKFAFGAVSAVILKPILKFAADILDNLKTYLPRILEVLATIMESLGQLFIQTGQMMEKLALNGMFGPIGFSMLPLGLGLQAIGTTVVEMSKDVRKVARHTEPKIDFNKMNAPFFADLRLMGVKI